MLIVTVNLTVATMLILTVDLAAVARLIRDWARNRITRRTPKEIDQFFQRLEVLERLISHTPPHLSLGRPPAGPDSPRREAQACPERLSASSAHWPSWP
jgi:hypothetical protein